MYTPPYKRTGKIACPMECFPKIALKHQNFTKIITQKIILIIFYLKESIKIFFYNTCMHIFISVILFFPFSSLFFPYFVNNFLSFYFSLNFHFPFISFHFSIFLFLFKYNNTYSCSLARVLILVLFYLVFQLPF